LYFSQADFPESFSPVNFIPIENGLGDPVTGLGTANDRLIVFTTNTMYRINTLPSPTDPGFGLGLVTREEITKDHGCVAKRTVTNFGVGQPNNRLFYLSTRGPMITDGYETYPVNEDLDWSKELVNFSRISGSVAVNFPKYQQVWLFVPSKSSMTNDMAFIYHYHPNHLKKGPVGSWLGPIHVRCQDAAIEYNDNSETRMYTADTDASGNVYREDAGPTDAQNYDDANGKIHWEWETGDNTLGEESANKRAQRVFLDVVGTDSFTPAFTYAIKKSDQENAIPLVNVTTNARTSVRFGTSNPDKIKSRTYRGGIWQTSSHFRWRMNETAAADRIISALEVELESFGRQR
jgi:hypothetical protein